MKSFIKYLICSFMLLLSVNTLAMDIVCDESNFCQLFVPNSELILVWEHSCIKHIQKKEWLRARQNKNVIDWQLANKKGLSASPDNLELWQNAYRDALAAKNNVGEKWKCNPPEAKLNLKAFSIGAPPQSQEPITKSFISNDTSSTDISSSVELISECKSPELKWLIGLKNNSIGKSYLNQYTINDKLPIPIVANGSRGTDLVVNIGIELFCDGALSDNLTYNVEQSEEDQLRQEYIDMQKKTVPKRNMFKFSTSYKEHGNHFSTEELNSTYKVTGNKYEYIIFKIFDNLEKTRRRARNVTMIVNSGYRNPYINKIIGGANESQHLYGRAVDIRLTDFNRDGTSDTKDWFLMAKAAKKEGACVEPYKNAPTWIHMDWRGTCPKGW